MSVAKSAVYVVGAKRTAFGAFGGKLKSFTATNLAKHSAVAALAQAGVNPELVDDVYYGNVIQSASDAAYLAR